MVSFNELEKGITIIISNQPYEIIETSHMFKGRGSSVLRAKLKNLINGSVLSKTFHQGDAFEESEIKKEKAKFLYSHKDKYFFCQENNPSNRFDLNKEQVGDQAQFLKANQIVESIYFNNEIINILIPIKINLKVTEAPPGVKGDRAQGGNKTVTLETGAKMNTPLFVKTGDIIEINTESGEYVKRVE